MSSHRSVYRLKRLSDDAIANDFRTVMGQGYYALRAGGKEAVRRQAAEVVAH